MQKNGTEKSASESKNGFPKVLFGFVNIQIRKEEIIVYRVFHPAPGIRKSVIKKRHIPVTENMPL